MKKRSILVIGIFLLLLSAVSCGSQGRKRVSELQDTLYVPQYAECFEILGVGKSSLLKIFNPWQGAAGVERELFLARDGEAPPAGFSGTTVQLPLNRVVCLSSSYIAFLDVIAAADAVVGVSGAQYVSNDTIRARYARGEVKDVGYDANMNYEMLAGLAPDLVLAYGVAGENVSMTAKLQELGIPIVYVGDYVEQSPLGKAEWLVAFGEMFDKREEAEIRFQSIRDNYLAVCRVVAKADSAGRPRPVVMLNTPYKDTWFMPGDRSYMIRLLEDAGGEYVCRGVDAVESRPISAEAAFLAAEKADVWLNPGQAKTLSEVLQLSPRFGDVPAVKRGAVYNNNRRSTPGGGSDFWESGAVHPDIVLKDLVEILHPGLLSGHELYYYQQMQ